MQPSSQLPPEPPLTLIHSSSFDDGLANGWSLGADWSLVTVESGLALQASNISTTVQQPLGDMAVQFRFSTAQAGLILRLRETTSGTYMLTLDANGYLTLLRNETVLASIAVASGAWRTLRVSVMDGSIRVNIDGAEIVTALDPQPLPPGTFSLASTLPQTEIVSALLIDDIFVWTPTTATPPFTAAPSSAAALTIQPLVLTALCSPDPAFRLWQVHNSNATDVLFTWDVENAGQSGGGVAPASSDSTFRTFAVADNPNNVRIFVDGILHDLEFGSAALCCSVCKSWSKIYATSRRSKNSHLPDRWSICRKCLKKRLP